MNTSRQPMKAYLLHETGGVEKLVAADVEKPRIGATDVLIETRAISINPVDVKVRQADELLTMISGTDRRPLVPGWDVAGTVVETGAGVSQFAPGDRVFGMVNFPGVGNACAEYVAAPADQLATIPNGISFAEAAATTLAALTALQTLRPRVRKGDRVLIHAGSGGVGHFAIQVARTLGAYVITTSSAKNRDLLMSLGADEHIDYREQDFARVLSDIDFVLDGMGGETLSKSLRVLRDGGSIVSLPTGDFPEEVTSYARRHAIDLAFELVQSSGSDMNVLRNMLEAGELHPHVSLEFAFADLAGAHRQIESGRTVGKVVVRL